jgi:hypothetical protein
MACTSPTATPTAVDDDAYRPQRRTQKRKRVRKNDGRLKRPINSFLLFAKEYRPALLNEHGRLNNQQVSKLLGVKWKSMTEDEKAPYTREAEAIHAKFMLDHPDFSWHGDKDHNKERKASSAAPTPKKRSRTSSTCAELGPRPAAWESLSPSAEFDVNSRRASEGDLFDTLMRLNHPHNSTPLLSPHHDQFEALGGVGHHPSSDDAQYSPASCSTPSSGFSLGCDLGARGANITACGEEVEVLQRGALAEPPFTVWSDHKPAPVGFKVVYVPLLVPDPTDPAVAVEEPFGSPPSALRPGGVSEPRYDLGEQLLTTDDISDLMQCLHDLDAHTSTDPTSADETLSSLFFGDGPDFSLDLGMPFPS